MNKILFEAKEEHIKNMIYYVPEDITEIGESAFMKSNNEICNTKRIILPEGLILINNFAFHECLTSIKEITIPSTVRRIGNYVFCGLDSLEKIFINSKINEMGIQAFCNCPKATIFFPNSEYIDEGWCKDWCHNCKIEFITK